MQKAFENITNTIDKYISPPPADIDDLVQNKQQAKQKAKLENTEARAETIVKISNGIDKSKEKDILKQGKKIVDKIKEQTKDNSKDKLNLIAKLNNLKSKLINQQELYKC